MLYYKYTQQVPFSDVAPSGVYLLNYFPEFLKGPEAAQDNKKSKFVFRCSLICTMVLWIFILNSLGLRFLVWYWDASDTSITGHL
jgi:F0F1-type ATP synthase membrane subunit a